MANNMMQAALSMLGTQQALGQLGQGYDKAVKRYDKNYYDPFTNDFSGASGMLRDSYGLGGAEGNRRAMDAFQAGPGYQFERDQGLDAINRLAASRGMLASGNNSMDLTSFAQNLANKRFGDWQSGLSDMTRLGMTAAEGQTGRQGSLASLDMGYGQGAANIAQRGAERMASLFAPQQERGGLGGAIAGGLNLAGSLLGLPMRGGGSVGGNMLSRFF